MFYHDLFCEKVFFSVHTDRFWGGGGGGGGTDYFLMDLTANSESSEQNHVFIAYLCLIFVAAYL